MKIILASKSPRRKEILSMIEKNLNREDFMSDLSSLNYSKLCKKWAEKPSLRLLYEKYIWGNRQKVFVWNLKQNIKKEKNKNA